MSTLYEQAKEIFNSMTLVEKVGQLFILAFPGKDPSVLFPIIDEYGIGGCYISQDNADTFLEARSLSRSLQKRVSLEHKTYKLTDDKNLPLILGVDQEGAWGVLIPEASIGPGNLALGISDDVKNTHDMYSVFAKEMKIAGYNTILGPCADINLNIHNPIIGTRSFGENTDRVSRHVSAAVQAIRSHGVLATAKHFPGHGDTSVDTHREIPKVDKTVDIIKSHELVPFQVAIDAGVDFIMTAHILFPHLDKENPATLSPIILTEFLRNQMKFEGLIITDSMNMGAIRKFYSPEDASVKAFCAGADLIMLSEEHYDHDNQYLDKQVSSIESIIHAVEKNHISKDILNDRVFRIIRKKLEMNVHKDIGTTNDDIQEQIRPHKNIENNVAKQAIKILRDRNNLLPMSKHARIGIINATPQSSYHNLINKRGIGPNQKEPAFQTFLNSIKLKSDHRTFMYEDIVGELQQLISFDALIVVTEDYPLPGEDFNKKEQQDIVIHLISLYKEKLIVLGFRSPYEIGKYKDLSTYVCAHSSRTCAAVAAAHFLFG